MGVGQNNDWRAWPDNVNVNGNNGNLSTDMDLDDQQSMAGSSVAASSSSGSVYFIPGSAPDAQVNFQLASNNDNGTFFIAPTVDTSTEILIRGVSSVVVEHGPSRIRNIHGGQVFRTTMDNESGANHHG